MTLSRSENIINSAYTYNAPVALQLDRGQIDQGLISGYAVLWSQGMTPGAFRSSLAYHAACGTLPILTWNANPGDTVGRILSAKEDDRGLYVTGQIALSTERGGILRQELLAGIDGLTAVYNEQAKDGGNVTQAHVMEISAMRQAAIPASTGAKARAPEFSNSIDFERWLRDHGIAKNMAKKLAAGGWQRLKSEDTEPGTLDDPTAKALAQLLSNANYELSTRR